MKIVYVITGLGIGGAEKQLISLANQLKKNNKITIITLIDNTTTFPFDEKSIDYIKLSVRKNPFSILFAIIRAIVLIKKIKPDIVHSHMIHANIFTRLLRFFIGFPVLISTAHNKNEGGKLRMFLYRITDWLATISTNVSQEAVDAFIEKKATKPGRMIPFYNGIDTTIFSYNETARKIKRAEINISNDIPLILAVGRLTEAKDYPNLLRAFSKLNVSVQPKLVIIGDGEENENLKYLSKELNISEHIIWLSIRHDVQDWMSSCDLFVLSSAWEGFGLVVAEAMACERLVIGTDSGGVSEVINKYGLIVPPKNTSILTSAIEQYLSLPDNEKNIIGKQARYHIVDNFSLDKISQEWLKLYARLLKK